MKYILISITASVMLAACSANHAEEKQQVTNSPVHYPVATVKKAGVAKEVKLPAQLSAYQEVSIFPKLNAYVQTVKVDIGSAVNKGTLLMTLEAPELEQAVVQAKEKYTRAQADWLIDKEKYHRLQEAARTAGAVSPLDLSSAAAKVLADSAVCNAQKAEWRLQQTMIDYLQVRAPFDGIITERNVHPGALVSAAVKDKPMLELKQVDHLRLQVDVPEAIAISLHEKDTLFFSTSTAPGKKIAAVLSRKSMNMNTQFRSERIEADVQNNNNTLAPGMYADVLLESKGNETALSVPRSAVVTSTERKYVWVVRNSVLVKVDVRTGNETTKEAEVFGDIKEGEQVILTPTDDMKEGIKM